jgi:hypothetical protein
LAWSADHPALAQPLAGLADGAGHADGRPAGAAAAADTRRAWLRAVARSSLPRTHAKPLPPVASWPGAWPRRQLQQAGAGQELRVQQQAAANLARARLNAALGASSWPA